MDGSKCDGGVDYRDGVKPWTGCFMLNVMLIGPRRVISSMIRRRGMSWRLAMLKARVVERAISDWSLLDHVMGQPQYVVTKLGWESNESHR